MTYLFLFVFFFSCSARSYTTELSQLFTTAGAKCSKVDKFSTDTLSRRLGDADSEISWRLKWIYFLFTNKQHAHTDTDTQTHTHFVFNIQSLNTNTQTCDTPKASTLTHKQMHITFIRFTTKQTHKQKNHKHVEIKQIVRQ